MEMAMHSSSGILKAGAFAALFDRKLLMPLRLPPQAPRGEGLEGSRQPILPLLAGNDRPENEERLVSIRI
ncbi:hypothetical protein LguiA_026051 [Lonicera macranthoides]